MYNFKLLERIDKEVIRAGIGMLLFTPLQKRYINEVLIKKLKEFDYKEELKLKEEVKKAYDEVR